ncbi:MAG: 50S ribosomal protein L11 methyltransferase [Alphaproteobacteria bacterium]|nr:50S ribosomal protein L11 methyltransferase [Alphaproteobacteria bacterium]
MGKQIFTSADIYSLDRPNHSPGPFRKLFRISVHRLSHRFILNRRSSRMVHAAGFRLAVPATVFHPKLFLTSEFFAKFIDTLNLGGKTVADVGTGSGILALAAARAGSAAVTAIDINPAAVAAAAHNSGANGFASRVTTMCGDLLSCLAPRPQFDVIVSNPPAFPGEPRDMADRAWVAGPEYRDIAPLFQQARERLRPSGVMYVILSSDSDLKLIGNLARNAGFGARPVGALSILIESMIIYELVPERAVRSVALSMARSKSSQSVDGALPSLREIA